MDGIMFLEVRALVASDATHRAHIATIWSLQGLQMEEIKRYNVGVCSRSEVLIILMG